VLVKSAFTLASYWNFTISIQRPAELELAIGLPQGGQDNVLSKRNIVSQNQGMPRQDLTLFVVFLILNVITIVAPPTQIPSD